MDNNHSQPFSIRFNRVSNGSAVQHNDTTNSDTVVTGPHHAIRSFLHQKPHRVHQRVLLRKASYVIITSLALWLAWAIGYWGWSVWLILGLSVLMYFVWKELSRKFTEATKQEIEMSVRRKKALQLSETAEWVNMAINRWWMTCNESVFGFIKDYIEPFLHEVIPAGIENLELVEFDLANQTPFLKNIQIFDPPNSASLSKDTLSSSNPTSTTCTTKAVIVANIDIGLVAPDSKLVMKARVGGKSIGYDTLVYIEGLHLSGNLQAIIHFDYDAPFPHVGWISATFTRKPDLWFSIRVLKGLKVTDIPIVKSFVHSLIMSIFQSLLVDPGRLEIDLMSAAPKSSADPQSSRRARGVLTVTFAGSPPHKNSKYENDPRRWVTFCLGSQKWRLQMPTGQESWKATYSFFVYDVKEDVLIIKVKHYRVMYTMTLAMHTISLSTIGLINEEGEEIKTNKYVSLGNSEANISLDLDYTPLPPFSLNYSLPVPETHQVAGVLYIHVHTAGGLRSGDMDGLSDPYCQVLVNKKKVLTTHYILDTLEPKWERGIELFVADVTQLDLTFVVYDWDGPLVGDDLLGSCKVSLESDKPYIIQKQLELEIDGSTVKGDKSLGWLTVSVIFRDVESVARSDLDNLNTIGQATGGHDSSHAVTTSAKNTPKQAWKKLKGMSGLLPGENFGIVELSIIEGRNLAPMDRNGYSDPYIIVKYGLHEMYRTPFVTKSLNPKWNCHCTLAAPPLETSIVVECWDKDQFTNDDFMGSLAFTSDDLLMFEDGPKWCQLQHITSGEILLGFKKSDTLQDSLSSGDTDDPSKIQLDQTINALEQDSTESIDQTIPHIVTADNNESRGSTGRINSLPSPLSISPRSVSPSYSTSHLPAVSSTPPPVLLPMASSSVNLRHRGSVGGGGKAAVGTKTRSLDNEGGSGGSSRRRSTTPSIGSGDSSLSTHSGLLLNHTIGTADAEMEFKSKIRRDTTGSRLSSQQRGLLLESSALPRQNFYYHNVSGDIIEAEGLKGNLDHLMLYIKIRLNCRPSHLRKHKFDRGPLLHKTRSVKGNSTLAFNESFVVKESPVPVESLLSIDLKSGSNVTLGTHVITLDKFFEVGNLKATKWLDLGNNMRVMMKLYHRPPHARSADLSQFDQTL